MTAAKKRIVEVERRAASEYWAKAEEYLEGMRNEATQGRHAGAATLGLHAAISAADAVCVRIRGVRNAGDHADAAALLREVAGAARGIEENATRLKRILGEKTPIEYGPRPLTEPRARELAKNVERFLDWARPLAIPG